ncbi:hypothetical protein [Metallibacterium sp.]
MSNQNHDAPYKSNPGNRDKQESGQHEKSGTDKHRDGQKAFESRPPIGWPSTSTWTTPAW